MSLINTPRAELGTFPTPLHELPNLRKAMGGPRLFIKREDLSGLVLGGNKTRVVERLLAYAKERGANAIVASGYLESNLCLHLTAGARRLNMETGLVLFADKRPRLQGNVLLQKIIAPRVRVRMVEGDPRSPALFDRRDEEMEKMAQEFSAGGYYPCTINLRLSEHCCLSASGWVDGAEELCQQLKEQNIAASHLVTAVGSGATAAGLMLGCYLLGSPLKIIGIAIRGYEAESRDNILRTANDTADYIGAGVRFKPEDVMVYNYSYMPYRYDIISRQCLEAMQLLAHTEGIFLDPIHTGRAMVVLINLIREGQLTKKDTVIFLHTGGIPDIFYYARQLQKALGSSP